MAKQRFREIQLLRWITKGKEEEGVEKLLLHVLLLR